MNQEGGGRLEEGKEVESKEVVSLHKVLMVCTNVGESSWGAKTGLWFDELSTPYYLFQEAGFKVDIACSTGKEIAV